MKHGTSSLGVWALGGATFSLVTLVIAGGCGDAPIGSAAAYGASEIAAPSESADERQSRADRDKPKRERTENASRRKSSDKRSRAMDQKKASNDQADDKQLVLTDREWRRRLSREEYHVLRQKGTERPFVNKYDHHFEEGAYACAGCGQILFDSDTKFNSGCGWPAFYAAKAGDRVKLTPDYSHGMIRTEVTCSKCDGHLGHIFDDAPQTPTGQRYCINSVSMKFIPAKKLKEMQKEEEKNREKEQQESAD